MIDFHSHVLPGIDDGAKDIETAAKMLELSKRQGVDTVVATPHFYSDKKTPDEFVKVRQESYLALLNYVKENNIDIPEIKLGAEVNFSYDIVNIDVEKLKIEGTNTILVELPFGYWNEWVYDNLFELSAKYRMDIVIAHLERYINKVKDLKFIERIFKMDVFIQVNADSLINKPEKKIADRMFKKYRVDLIGSDMHNLHSRTTNMDKAQKIISKKYGQNAFMTICKNAEQLL